jgi:NAD(P)-dependent dehydrogenase (short-subunit alcohol dehydrogenase family)
MRVWAIFAENAEAHFYSFSIAFQVNVIGHVMFTAALMPSLKTAKDAAPSVVMNMSARVGSITDNGLGGWYSYRMSKTALNQATRTMAHELKRQGGWAIAMHPVWPLLLTPPPLSPVTVWAHDPFTRSSGNDRHRPEQAVSEECQEGLVVPRGIFGLMHVGCGRWA